MLQNGVSINEISRITDISLDEINILINKKVKNFLFFDKKGHMKILKW